MKKKFLTMLSLILMIVPCVFLLTACVGSAQHTHESGYTWISNTTHHWKECVEENCGVKFSYSQHNWDQTTNKCTVCERIYQNNLEPSTPPATTAKYTVSLYLNNSQYGEVYGDGTYQQNETVTIAAVAKEGYFFSHWEDGSLQTTRQITLNSNKTYRAIFFAGSGETIKVNNHFVTVVNGTIHSENTTSFKISPNNKYSFSYWWTKNDQTIDSTTKERTITKQYVTKDIVYTAENTLSGVYYLSFNENYWDDYCNLELDYMQPMLDVDSLSNIFQDKFSCIRTVLTSGVSSANGLVHSTAEFTVGEVEYKYFDFQTPANYDYCCQVVTFRLKGQEQELVLETRNTQIPNFGVMSFIDSFQFKENEIVTIKTTLN